MKTVLQINSSARVARSHTRYLVELFITRWRTLRPLDIIISREIGTRPPPAISEQWIAAAFRPAQERTKGMKELLALSDALVDELTAADLIVLGAPMYNFGMPSQLKAYVDQVIRVGRTFELDTSNQKQPYKPLLTDKRMVVLTSSGDAGYEPGGPNAHMNHLDPHIRTAFGFIGITDIDFVGVGYDEFPDDRIKYSLSAAESAIGKLVGRLAATDDSERQRATANGRPALFWTSTRSR